ncbi:uncharacterized protein N0V89_005855 [Didymosphaeria variabile]|uniref:Zn(2)-C6 fungal-type domain-containing protein n=1 Tax=Didymosphaeria variabile TaxID=1932322 RepID=A0A9W8XPA7_9PLEO|nr:uncharacterized protein N0V89_005855 [Didymosphaeria variabile]KAJ4354122.1 hypothetical protein N0V89_005855 [Didymosphaeria variabile]
MPSSTAADASDGWISVTGDHLAQTPARLQLPACQKCRLRKVRCDRNAPKCANCILKQVACIIVDPETGAQYARDYLRQLEEEEVTLKTKLGNCSIPSYDPPTALPSDSPDQAEGPTIGSTASHNYYVGDGSGLGFLHNILSDSRWQEHRVRIMHQLAARPIIQRQLVQPNPLPPLLEAEALLDNYFTRFHIHHTFLLRDEVLGIFNRLYSPSVENPITNQDRFRLFMVFAISATTRHRAGLSAEDPYGYFKAAEGYLVSVPLIKDLDAVQNLLLIARFGMYHHIGTSLWEISQVCMRQCIEWRLHTLRSITLDPLREQHRRRIFWECYILDRYSSGILGRPFAILENDISVGLPLDVDDETLMASAAPTLDQVGGNTSSSPTEISIFIHCIKLRQISSRIHTRFYTGPGLDIQPNGVAKPGRSSRNLSIGHIYMCFSRFQAELEAWRSTAPIYPNPRSLYERPEWHDFLHEKDLMLLARGALHNIPPRSLVAEAALKEIFIACYSSARQVIELYASLMDKRAITWTRSYFQVIFTAGLTLIYCLNLDVIKLNATESGIYQSLETCQRILQFFKEKMPDAGSFTLAFELLKTECVKPRILTTQEVRHTDSATPFGPSDSGLTSSNSGTHSVNLGSLSNPVGIPDIQYNPFVDPQLCDLNIGEPNFGFMEDFDLMTQLEAGLGEYAWGWIPLDDNFSDQMHSH